MDGTITVHAFDKIHGLESSSLVHVKSDEQHVGIFVPFGFEIDFPIEDLRKLVRKLDEESGCKVS
jgi:hypothetical protein